MVMQFEAGQHIHFIGIGGFGMSAIARVLLLRGFKISGSDRNKNALNQALARDGATVYIGHDASYVDGADMVIATSAAKPDHVEIVEANKNGIPVYKRNDIIAPLMDGYHVIAVAGTHGKTTTTSMLVHILQSCRLDPSYIVGGVMGNTGTNAGVGTSNIFVIEADEYDNMFHGLKPDSAVITNLEYDHPDFFESEEALYQSFLRFADNIQDCGELVLGLNGALSERLLADIQHHDYEIRTVGVNAESKADFYPYRIKQAAHFTTFAIKSDNMLICPHVGLPIPGMHNIQNAIMAQLVAGVRFEESALAIETFKTTGRRFDVQGEVDGVVVIDDYAHHPTAIRTTLEAVKMRYPDKQVWAIWQPHTYSRTKTLLDQYATAFDSADKVLITDIYPARETPIKGVDGASTAKAIQHEDVCHVSTFEQMVTLLIDDVEVPAVIIIMSAGDAVKIGADYLRRKHQMSRLNEAGHVD